MKKSDLISLAGLALSVIGMILTSKAQDSQMQDLKEEIKLELKQEKEN